MPVDAVAQILGERMRLALRLVELIFQNLLGKLHIAVVGGVLGIGQRRPQRAAVLTEHLFKRRARVRLAAGNVGHQRAVIAQIELRPFRLLRQIDALQRARHVAGGELGPAARDRRRQFADRIFGRGFEMFVGFCVSRRF